MTSVTFGGDSEPQIGTPNGVGVDGDGAVGRAGSGDERDGEGEQGHGITWWCAILSYDRPTSRCADAMPRNNTLALRKAPTQIARSVDNDGLGKKIG